MTSDVLQEALVDLVRRSELRDVITYEHGAVRLEGGVESKAEAETSLQAKVRTDGALFEARFRMDYTDGECSAVTDVGVVFEVSGDAPSAAVIPPFLEQVAVMAAFPYLREGVGNAVARLGLRPPVLGVIRRGQVSFGQGEDGEPEAQ